MSSRSLCISMFLVVVGLSSAARAAGVGRGTMMISAERLFGLSAIHTSQDIPGGELNTDHQHFGIGLAPTLALPSIYSVPRLAFDLALVDGLTLGGALGFVVGDFDPDTTQTTFLVAPRIGYVLGFNKTVSLWLRGGFTYFNFTTRDEPDDDSFTIWGMSLNVEPTLMIAPIEHVAFTAGLLLDLPLAGKQVVEVTAGPVTRTTSVGYRVRHIGLLAGLVVVF